MPDHDTRFGYQPALDGVRAVAVAMVLVFHLDLGFYHGGYLGVSVFFTLSGFLITSLLIRERSSTGRVSFRAFYLRRVRRLLPASLTCIAAVALLASIGAFDRSGDARPGVLGALFQVQNWVSLGREQSYADLFAAPSPLDHFWSLAIEEQFYWMWPVAFAGIGVIVGRSTRRATGYLPLLTGLFAVAAVSTPLTHATLGADWVYFATWTRIAEIFAGAALAALLAGRAVPRAGSSLGWVCLGLVVAAGAALPTGRGLAYEGWLPLFAVISCGLIAGLQSPGALRSALSARPLVLLGRISFGVYLYHWPVFVLLDRTRTGLDRWPLAALRLAVTLGVSVLSYHLLERPIRERRRLVATHRFVAGLSGAVTAVALFTVVAVTAPTATDAFERDIVGAVTLAPSGSLTPLAPPAPVTTPAAATTASATTEPPAPTTAPTTPPTTPPTTAPTTTELVPVRPVRMLVVGDSTAQALGNGIAAWALERPDLAEVEVRAVLGCGLLGGGDRWFDNTWTEVPAGCTEQFDAVPTHVAEVHPDIVVVITSFWEVTDHRWPDDGNATRTPRDVEFRDRLGARFTSYDRALLDAGATKVVWVVGPAADYGWENVDEPGDEPDRYDILAEVIRDTAAGVGPGVEVVELARWLRERGLDTDRTKREDGVHFTLPAATDIARSWLGHELVVAAVAP